MKHNPWYDADVNDPEDYPSGKPDGPSWWPGLVAILVIGFILLLVAFSTGCAEMPLTLSVYSEYGRASYSSKGGLEISIQK